MAIDLLEDGLGRRAAPQQYGRGADIEGEVLRISETVGKEELGHGEAAIPGPNAKDLVAVRPAADPGIVLQVDDPFRLSRRTARIEEKCDPIAMCRGISGDRESLAEPSLCISALPASAAVIDDRQAIHDAPVEDEQTRVAIGEDGFELLGLQERVERNGHSAARNRAPEGDRKEGAIGQDQGDSISVVDALVLQGGREAPDELLELAVGRLSLVRYDRDAPSPALRDTSSDEPLRGVEAVWQVATGTHMRCRRLPGIVSLRAVSKMHRLPYGLGRSWRIIQDVPNLSLSWPKRTAKKVKL